MGGLFATGLEDAVDGRQGRLDRAEVVGQPVELAEIDLWSRHCGIHGATDYRACSEPS